MSGRLLPAARFAAARRFLREKARPLEAARFRFHFEGAPAGDVLRELEVFQCEDGGFGRALEPDLRAPESSAIATSVALQVAREVGAMRDELAERALRYLLAAYDAGTGGWRIVPETTDAHPHAPWWQQEGRDHDYDTFGLNPTAEILGYLLERRDVAAGGFLERVVLAVTRELSRPGALEMHDLLCCLRLHETDGLPDGLARALDVKIQSTVDATVVRDPAGWSTYGLRPLQVAATPSSPFLPGLEEAVELQLDHQIETQEADGSWSPTWDWGDAWPDVWPTARREWAGVLTLEGLRVLRRFGRTGGSNE